MVRGLRITEGEARGGENGNPQTQKPNGATALDLNQLLFPPKKNYFTKNFIRTGQCDFVDTKRTK